MRLIDLDATEDYLLDGRYLVSAGAMTNEERWRMCKECETKKECLRMFGIRIDWKECPYPCRAKEQSDE